MKKIIYISLISLLCLPMYSCLDASSLMDKEDVGDLYEDDVFTSGTYARYFVNDIYYNIISNGYDVSGWGGAYMDCATDNGEGPSAHRCSAPLQHRKLECRRQPPGFYLDQFLRRNSCLQQVPGELAHDRGGIGNHHTP